MSMSRDRIADRVRDLSDTDLRAVDEYVAFLEWRATHERASPADNGQLPVVAPPGKDLSPADIERQRDSGITPPEFYREMIGRPEIRAILEALAKM